MTITEKPVDPFYILTYEQISFEGGESVDFDDGPYSGFNHTVNHVTDVKLAISYTYYSPTGLSWESCSQLVQDSHDELWVVYNIYTFGRTEGNVDFVGVAFSAEEADRLQKTAEEIDYGYFGKRQTTKAFKTLKGLCMVFHKNRK